MSVAVNMLHFGLGGTNRWMSPSNLSRTEGTLGEGQSREEIGNNEGQ
jgi:hypothetical protein